MTTRAALALYLSTTHWLVRKPPHIVQQSTVCTPTRPRCSTVRAHTAERWVTWSPRHTHTRLHMGHCTTATSGHWSCHIDQEGTDRCSLPSTLPTRYQTALPHSRCTSPRHRGCTVQASTSPPSHSSTLRRKRSPLNTVPSTTTTTATAMSRSDLHDAQGQGRQQYHAKDYQ